MFNSLRTVVNLVILGAFVIVVLGVIGFSFLMSTAKADPYNESFWPKAIAFMFISFLLIFSYFLFALRLVFMISQRAKLLDQIKDNTEAVLKIQYAVAVDYATQNQRDALKKELSEIIECETNNEA
jgi:ATP-dependent Zn protease